MSHNVNRFQTPLESYPLNSLVGAFQHVGLINQFRIRIQSFPELACFFNQHVYLRASFLSSTF